MGMPPKFRVYVTPKGEKLPQKETFALWERTAQRSGKKYWSCLLPDGRQVTMFLNELKPSANMPAEVEDPQDGPPQPVDPQPAPSEPPPEQAGMYNPDDGNVPF